MSLMTVVNVKLLDRGDGGLRVSSDTLPGLILSGPDKKEVCACIEPAIKAIFEHRGYTVTAITASEPIDSIMKLPSPRNVDMKIDHQFVVEFKSAA